MEPVIHIRGVQKSFPGPQGRLRILCGLETADDGTVERRGAPVTGPGADCGMVFQDHRLLPWLTVADNVAFGLRQVPRAQKRALVAEYLNLVGLADYAKSYPAQLSGGMAQRAAIARSLVTKPEILLLDEPFAALDALTRIQMQQEVRRLQATSGITMVLIPSISTFYISQKLGNGKFFLIGDAIEGQYVANNLHFAAAIAFILMLILLAAMALMKRGTNKRVYGGV